MICGACGRDNRHGAKFCTECGAALQAACPACGAMTEPGEKFCAECGSALAAGISDRPSSPKTLGVSGEKKHITVLFADVAGSMDLQEQMDSEVWAQIMGRFVSILAEGVRKFGGTVDKFTGDGIMALFGAPVAQEDHARRACHAAWHLTKAIGEYSEKLRRDQGVELHVRLGLNSGEVVVGRVGEDVTLDPTALGHTVGLAQRMEAMAEPGRAYLSEYTARLVDGWFQLEDLGRKSVKGVRDPLGVYMLGIPLSVTRAPRTVGRSPLVGRDRELAVLEDALTATSEGEARVVGVVGDAGVGKSRLFEEFAHSVAARGVTVRRTVGVSHGQDVPLLPVLALLRQDFGITHVDEPGEARDKVRRHLLALDRSLEGSLPLLFDFLEIPDPGRPGPQLAPDVRRRRVLAMARRVSELRTKHEVEVLFVEDLHWFDPVSEVFLQGLVGAISGTRTLIVANFRPGYSVAWTGHPSYQQLRLAPLGEDAVRDLLVALVGDHASLAPLQRLVPEWTRGNPFFVEELVRVLVEDGTLAGRPADYRLCRPVNEARVPPSVQVLLAERIDRLHPAHKAVLQTAAVIGGSFSESLLSKVIGGELEEALDVLCRAELVQAGNGAEYRFWHPLTREVAYNSLLVARRRLLHAAVAEALEEHDTDRLEEQSGLLAWHWQQAGRPVEATRWTTRAAAFALRNDLSEACRRWRAVHDLLKGVEETRETLELAVRAYVRLLQFAARTGIDPDEAESLYFQGRGLAERLGDPGLRGMTVLVSAAGRFWTGDLKGALNRALEATEMGAQSHDPEVEAAVSIGTPLVLAQLGPLGDGLDKVERILALTSEHQERGVGLLGGSPRARALQTRGVLLARMGQLARAPHDVEEAIKLARGRGDLETLCWSLAWMPQLAWFSRTGDHGIETAEEATRIGEDTGNIAGLVVGLEGLAFAHLNARQPDLAAVACERGLTEARQHRSGLFEEASLLVALVLARRDSDDLAGAAAAAEEAVVVARQQGARVLECWALLTRAQGMRLIGAATDVVLADLHTALALVKDTGALTYEPFIHEELGRIHDDEDELCEALRLYRQIGATGHGRRLEAELAGSPRWSR